MKHLPSSLPHMWHQNINESEMDLVTMMMQMEKKLTDDADLYKSPPPPPLPSMEDYYHTAPASIFYSASNPTLRDMVFREAAMQPVDVDPESMHHPPPKRRNVRISTDPQSVAARRRRERISEKIRVLQRLVPGGTKMDTASMLEEAIHYVKFLKSHVQTLERAAASRSSLGGGRSPVELYSSGGCM